MWQIRNLASRIVPFYEYKWKENFLKAFSFYSNPKK